MRNFVGFKRRAVVIVPTDEEFKKRCEKRDKEEGKDIPDSAVLDMKGVYLGICIYICSRLPLFLLTVYYLLSESSLSDQFPLILLHDIFLSLVRF